MVVVAQIADVPNFGKKAVSVDGRELLLVNIKGEIFACENECPHQGAPMNGGVVKDGHISCPRHGFRFDLKTGACKDNPAYTLKLFPAIIQGNDIMVDLG